MLCTKHKAGYFQGYKSNVAQQVCKLTHNALHTAIYIVYAVNHSISLGYIAGLLLQYMLDVMSQH